MADMDKFSDRLIDLAERFADVTDAAQGRGNRHGSFQARWLIIPAAGAGLFALGASGSVTRQAKSVAKQAKDRASELPDDLMKRVHQATRTSSATNGARSSAQTSRTQRSTSRSKTRRRRTQTASAR
jgi:hypothetical protein